MWLRRSGLHTSAWLRNDLFGILEMTRNRCSRHVSQTGNSSFSVQHSRRINIAKSALARGICKPQNSHVTPSSSDPILSPPNADALSRPTVPTIVHSAPKDQPFLKPTASPTRKDPPIGKPPANVAKYPQIEFIDATPSSAIRTTLS